MPVDSWSAHIGDPVGVANARSVHRQDAGVLRGSQALIGCAGDIFRQAPAVHRDLQHIAA